MLNVEVTGANYWIAFILGSATALGTGAAMYAFFHILKNRALKTSYMKSVPNSEQTENVSTPNLSKYHLIVLENMRRSNQRWSVDLTHDLIIGRQDDCPLKDLKDPSLSRRHCKITDTEDGPAVWNLSKVNETHVNHAVIKDGQILHEGDTLSLGREQLRVMRIRYITDSIYSPQLESADDSLNKDGYEDSVSANHVPNEETGDSFW